jgi:hypothetical protein
MEVVSMEDVVGVQAVPVQEALKPQQDMAMPPAIEAGPQAAVLNDQVIPAVAGGVPFPPSKDDHRSYLDKKLLTNF